MPHPLSPPCPPSSLSLAAIRVFAAAVGAAALQQPTVELSPTARPPLPSSPFAAPEAFSLPMELELGAAGLTEAGDAGWGLPLAVAVPAVAAGRPCSPDAGTPQHRAPPPTPAAAQQAQRLQQAQQASEWPSLQALLMSEPEQPLPGLGGGAAVGGMPACEGATHDADSEAASGPAAAAFDARADADPLARFSLAENLSLSCSLGASDPLFDASCLDFLCAEAC